MEVRDLLQVGFRYAYSLTQSQHDAEDLVQDAWIKLSRVEKSNCNKSLLLTTVRNLFIDQYRRKKLCVFDSIDDVDEPAEWDNTALTHISMDEMEVAMQSIRVEEREAIYLNIVEGYTAQEIALLSDRSRNTVLGLIARGKKKLVKYFQQKMTEKISEG